MSAHLGLWSTPEQWVAEGERLRRSSPHDPDVISQAADAYGRAADCSIGHGRRDRYRVMETNLREVARCLRVDAQR